MEFMSGLAFGMSVIMGLVDFDDDGTVGCWTIAMFIAGVTFLLIEFTK